MFYMWDIKVKGRLAKFQPYPGTWTSWEIDSSHSKIKFNRHRLTSYPDGHMITRGYGIRHEFHEYDDYLNKKSMFDNVPLGEIMTLDIRKTAATSMYFKFVYNTYQNSETWLFHEIERELNFSVRSISQANNFITLLKAYRVKGVKSLSDAKYYRKDPEVIDMMAKYERDHMSLRYWKYWNEFLGKDSLPSTRLLLKLAKRKEKGLIDEETFELAKSQILNRPLPT